MATVTLKIVVMMVVMMVVMTVRGAMMAVMMKLTTVRNTEQMNRLESLSTCLAHVSYLNNCCKKGPGIYHLTHMQMY